MGTKAFCSRSAQKLLGRLDAIGRRQEFPFKFGADKFPYLVLAVQFVFGFQKWKTRQVFIFANEFTEFIQHKTIRQEIFTILRTMFLEWFLNLDKHESQSIFERLGHCRRPDPIEDRGDVRCVLVVLVESEFL